MGMKKNKNDIDLTDYGFVLNEDGEYSGHGYRIYISTGSRTFEDTVDRSFTVNTKDYSYMAQPLLTLGSWLSRMNIQKTVQSGSNEVTIQNYETKKNDIRDDGNH